MDTTITPLDDALRPFSAAHLRLTLRPENVLRLPPQQGSTVRGALAASVKGLVCTRRDLRECGPCPEVQSCAYPYLFETSPPPGVSGTRGYEQFPRPYIISYPAPAPRAHTGALEGPVRGANTESSPGRRRDPGLATQSDREIGLTLVGQAVQFFPYLALALRDLENKGLGRGRGRFELVRVDALDLAGQRTLVYESTNNWLYGVDCIIEGASILDTVSKALNGGSAEESAGGVVGVRFVSPTDLHRQGKSAGAPDFHILVRNLLRRVSLLSLGHCGCRMELDFNEWIHRAEEVETVSVRSKRIEWERVSNRQDRRVPMGGFCGEIVYRGNIAPFLGLLLLGSLVHVGDNCAFGMGRYLVGLPGVPWMPWGWVFTGEGT